MPHDAGEYEGSVQLEQKASSLYLVCPSCLASIKKPRKWHRNPPRSTPAVDTADTHRSYGTGSSDPKPFPKRAKGICRRIGSLVVLVTFLACFSLCGAAIFKAIEGPNEEAVIIQLNIAKLSLISRAYDLAQEFEFEEFSEAVNRSLAFYDRVAGAALKHGITAGQVEPRWSFRSALFYCVTIFTTIGYGNVCPTTALGRVTTIMYGLVAIPLFLVIIGKVGRYLAAGLNHCYLCSNKLLLLCCCIRVKSTTDEANEEDDDDEDVRKPLIPAGPLATSHSTSSLTSSNDDVELMMGPMLAIVIAVGFMLAGSVMYLLWEPWSFLEAFYFVFISLSTIGFGDFVPTHPTFFMLSSVYLFIGLALISMVINVLISFYTSAYAKAHDTLAQSGLCAICRK